MNIASEKLCGTSLWGDEKRSSGEGRTTVGRSAAQRRTVVMRMSLEGYGEFEWNGDGRSAAEQRSR